MHINGDLEFNREQQRLLPTIARIAPLSLVLPHRNNAKHLNMRAQLFHKSQAVFTTN